MRTRSLMPPNRLATLVLVAAGLLPLLPSGAAAGSAQEQGLVITDDAGNHARVSVTGDRIEVVTVEGGATSVHTVDLGELDLAIDEAVDSALAGLDVALAELRDRDVSVVLDEGLLTVSEGQRVCTVDVATMLGELESGLQGLFAGRGELSPRIRVITDDEHDHEAAQLRDELDSLKAEVDRLRDDLQRLR